MVILKDLIKSEFSKMKALLCKEKKLIKINQKSYLKHKTLSRNYRHTNIAKHCGKTTNTSNQSNACSSSVKNKLITVPVTIL